MKKTKSIDEFVNFTDKYGNKYRKHIRAKSIAEFNAKVKKIEEELNHSLPLNQIIDEWYEHKKDNAILTFDEKDAWCRTASIKMIND